MESFQIEAEKITPDAKIYDDLDIDSIDAVDLLVRLQPFLGEKQVSPKDFKQVRTIDDLTRTLVRIINEP